MNADEAKRDAIRALSARLHQWDVPEPDRKAWSYVNDLALAGWLWMPPNNRPRPPRPAEACRDCGRHVTSCLCDSPTVRPIPKPDPEVLSARVLELKSNVVPLRATPPNGDAS